VTGNAPIQSTRVGCITFDIPRGRGGLEFYHSTLDKCIRSEQALKVALAEMSPPNRASAAKKRWVRRPMIYARPRCSERFLKPA